jgi:exodeoxyribonuclease VII small subunit
MEKLVSYSEAIAELELIVTEIEQGEISVDTLSEKVKRAADLIKICKAKLSSTEDDVNKILGEIKNEKKKAAGQTCQVLNALRPIMEKIP